MPAQHDRSLAVPLAFLPESQPGFRIGAQVHIFYADLAGEIRQRLDHLGPGALAMVTTDSEAKRAVIEAAFAGWGERLEIRIFPNRGRDIAAKLLAFADRYDEFDLLVFAHSKKTEWTRVGSSWRDLLYDGTFGSEAVVRSILALFALRPDAGMVFPQHHESIRRFTGWQWSFSAAQQLARHWDLRLRRRGVIEFPSGSMFWARPAALRPILDIGLTLEDFPEEAGQTDGTVAHAVERLFALACEIAGYRWYKVSAPAHYSDHRAMAHPASAEALAAYLDENPIRLLDTMVHA